MKAAVRDFGQLIRGGSVGLFYFSGHGVQVNGINYLILVGAVLQNESEIEFEAMPAGFVIAQMEAAENRTNILVLDACRNNPFARSFRSPKRGLAPIDAPAGTLVAYATAPGSTASDGSGKNGLYTGQLLKHMRTPSIGVEEVFKRVRTDLVAMTNGQQVPWELSSLTGQFSFVPESASGSEAASSLQTAAEAPSSSVTQRIDPVAVELSFWESIKNSSNRSDFQAYLDKYPYGQFAALARNRISGAEPSAQSHSSSPTSMPSAIATLGELLAQHQATVLGGPGLRGLPTSFSGRGSQKYSSGREVTFTLLIQGGKYVLTSRDPRSRAAIVAGYDGQHGWLRTPNGQLRQEDAMQDEWYLRAAAIMFLTEQKLSGAVYQGVHRLADTSVHVIEGPDGGRLYVDMIDAYVIGYDHGPSSAQIALGNYRDVQGNRVPFRWELRSPSSRLPETLVFEEIVLNSPIPDASFAMPLR
jgi:hypothetical protein